MQPKKPPPPLFKTTKNKMNREKVKKVAKITSINLVIYLSSFFLFAKFTGFFLMGLEINECGFFCKMDYMVGFILLYPILLLTILGTLFYKNKMSILLNILTFFIGSWNGLVLTLIIIPMVSS